MVWEFGREGRGWWLWAGGGCGDGGGGDDLFFACFNISKGIISDISLICQLNRYQKIS